MAIFGVSMGALIGLPPSLVEIYSSDIKKVYMANGIPLYLGVLTHFVSAFIHLLIMCTIIFFSAPFLFDASAPKNILVFYVSLAIFIATTLSIGCVFGLMMKNMAKLTMVSQIIFMPSLMLSGIMFPVDLLPKILERVGRVFPATWAFRATAGKEFDFSLCIPMLIIFVVSVVICKIVLSKKIHN